DNIFKKEGKTAGQQHPERGVRICERNNSADTKDGEEGGGGGAPGTGAEIPLQPVVQTLVRQAGPLQPMEEPTPEQQRQCPGVWHPGKHTRRPEQRLPGQGNGPCQRLTAGSGGGERRSRSLAGGGWRAAAAPHPAGPRTQGRRG
ncbi:unnamed protein product, partial [Bubo scandiacus]